MTGLPGPVLPPLFLPSPPPLPPLLVSPDPDLFLKTARLRRLPSSASDLASNDVASLRETTADPFTEGCACQRDGLTVIVTACLTFATAVTVALIMQIYFGEPQVTDGGGRLRCFAVLFCLLVLVSSRAAEFQQSSSLGPGQQGSRTACGGDPQ